MKKDSVVSWIVAVILIAATVPFSATLSQGSDLTTQMQAKGCDFHRMQQGDQVLNVRLSNIWGNTMWFDIDISVNAAHYYGSDGIARPGGRLKNVFVEVLAFDGNGNNLTRSFTSGHGGLVGTSTASASVTLTNAQALSQLVDLLVSVWEGTSGGFRFCQVWKYANVYPGGASSQPKVYTVPTYPQPAGQQPRIVGIAISRKSRKIFAPERIYTYFDNGKFSVIEANLWDPLKMHPKNIIKSESYYHYLPSGKSPHDIVGVAMSPSDRIYVWFNDNTFISGTPNRLGSTLMHYDPLPNGKSPMDIVGMAIDPENLVHTWFKDGSTCLGRPNNLSAYRPHDNYRPKFSNPIDVHGMAINWRGDVYTWYQNRVLIGKYPELNRFGAFNADRLIPRRELIGGP